MRFKAFSVLAVLLLLTSALAAQEFAIWPAADYWDSPAVAFNGTDDNWIVLAHHNDVLSMRRAGWNDSGPWAGSIRVLDDVYASSYAIAWNWDDSRYLAAWIVGSEVLASLVDHRARPVGEPITLYSSASDVLAVDVVYLGTSRNRWLVVWQKYVSGSPDQLLMQVIKADGTKEGPVFDIGSGTYGPWTIACNTKDANLLMVWEGASELRGRIFLDTGDTLGDVLSIGSGSEPAAAYARTPNRFLLAWKGDSDQVEGRAVVGGVLQPTVTIADEGDAHYPGLAYNRPQRRFLAAWTGWLGNYQIRGQRVRESGVLERGPHLVSTTPEWKGNLNEEFLACSTLVERCLVTWWQDGNQIWGRFVTDVRLLTAARSGSGSGTVSSSPPGVYCGGDCSEHYLIDQVVVLDADADYNSVFTGWSGDRDCGDGVVTMSTDKTCTASFEADTCPTDAWEPDDSAAQASSIASGVAQTHSICPIGDEDWATFTLGAESAVELRTSGPSGDTRMWLYDSSLSQIEYDDDGGTGLFSFIDRTCGVDSLPAGTYYVKVDEYGDSDEIESYDLAYTLVEFCPPTLSVVKPGSGVGSVSSAPAGIDCGGTCSAQFPHGTPVTLTATAAAGSAFAHWGGACSSLTSTCDLTLTANATAAATFVPAACVVTLAGHAVTGPELHESCYMLVVGPAVTVEDGGDLDARAASMIVWLDGFSVLAGGSASATIDPSLATP
jgi:hypothetical protein